MNQAETKELHDLLFSFMCLFHEKFISQFRVYYDAFPWMKKNHIKIVNTLSQHDYLTSTEIGKKLDIEKGSLTSLIDTLQEKGLVVRSHDLKDRRKSLISLSPEGQKMIQEMLSYHHARIDNILSGIGAEEAQQFMSDLRSVVDLMKKM